MIWTWNPPKARVLKAWSPERPCWEAVESLRGGPNERSSGPDLEGDPGTPALPTSSLPLSDERAQFFWLRHLSHSDMPPHYGPKGNENQSQPVLWVFLSLFSQVLVTVVERWLMEMSFLPSLIYKVISINLLDSYFIGGGKMILKSIWKGKIRAIAYQIPTQTTKLEEVYYLILRLYSYKNWNCLVKQEYRYMEGGNKTEIPAIDTRECSQ